MFIARSRKQESKKERPNKTKTNRESKKLLLITIIERLYIALSRKEEKSDRTKPNKPKTTDRQTAS